MKGGERTTAAVSASCSMPAADPTGTSSMPSSPAPLRLQRRKPPVEMQFACRRGRQDAEQIIQAAVGRRASDKPGYTGLSVVECGEEPREFHSRRYHATRSGAQSVGRDRADEEPPNALQSSDILNSRQTRNRACLDVAVVSSTCWYPTCRTQS